MDNNTGTTPTVNERIDAACDRLIAKVLESADSQCFGAYDDLVEHDIRTYGFVTARRVA